MRKEEKLSHFFFGLITKKNLKAESKKAEHHVSDSRATTTPSVCGEFIFNTLLIYIKDVQQQLRKDYMAACWKNEKPPENISEMP